MAPTGGFTDPFGNGGFLSASVPSLPNVRYLYPGTSAAGINQAIIDAQNAGGGTVALLGNGTYRLEAPIDIGAKSNITLDLGQAQLLPTFTIAGADNSLNAIIRVTGTVDTATMNTTISTLAGKGSTAWLVTAAGTIAVGHWILTTGRNVTTDAIAESNGTSTTQAEIQQIGSITGGGLTLNFKGGAKSYTYRAASVAISRVIPSTNITIRGGDLRGDGLHVAVGILVQSSVNVDISGVRGGGFSKALIQVETGARQITIDQIYNRGECNSIISLDAVQDVSYRRIRCNPEGLRFHADGIQRGLVNRRNRCTDIMGDDSILENGCIGIRDWGTHQGTYTGHTVINMDATQADTTGTAAGEIGGHHFGAGYDGGAGPLAYAEFGFFNSIAAMVLDFVRHPDASAGVGFYLHDLYQSMVTGAALVNNGFPPNTGPPYAWGFTVSDSFGSEIKNIQIKGVAGSFVTENNADCYISGMIIDGSAGNGSNAANGLKFNDSGGPGTSARLSEVKVVNTVDLVRFGASYVLDTQAYVEKLLIASDYYDFCVHGKNNTGTAFTIGEICEMLPASAAGARDVGTGAAAHPRPAIVASGLPTDVGTGFMLIAPCPQRMVRVKMNAAVAVGNKIQANAARLGVVIAPAAVADIISLVGTALETTSGAGYALCGPAA